MTKQYTPSQYRAVVDKRGNHIPAHCDGYHDDTPALQALVDGGGWLAPGFAAFNVETTERDYSDQLEGWQEPLRQMEG